VIPPSSSVRPPRGCAVVLLLLAFLHPTAEVVAQDAPGSHRRWLLALAGGVVLGLPAALADPFPVQLGSCNEPGCVAPVAAAVGVTVGFLLGKERDEAAARRFVAGPRLQLPREGVALPFTPERVVPVEGGAVALGVSGMAHLAWEGPDPTVGSARGMAAGAAFPERGLLLTVRPDGVFAFSLLFRDVRGRLLAGSPGGTGIAALGPDQVAVLGGGGIRILELDGGLAELGLREVGTASSGEPPVAAAPVAGSHLLWVLTRTRLAAVDTEQFRELGGVEIPILPLGMDVDAASGLGVVAGGSQGLLILDLTRPAEPVVLHRYTGVREVKGAVVEGRLVYVAAGDQGFVVLDLSDPLAPEVVGVSRNLGDPSSVQRGVDGLLVTDRAARRLHRLLLPLPGLAPSGDRWEDP